MSNHQYERFQQLSNEDQAVFTHHKRKLGHRFHVVQHDLGMKKDDVGIFIDEAHHAIDSDQRAHLARHSDSLLEALEANGSAAEYLRSSYAAAQECHRGIRG